MSDLSKKPDEDLLNKKDLCKKLSISNSFLYNLIRQGLPVIRISGAIRFRYSDVIGWIEHRNLERDVAANMDRDLDQEREDLVSGMVMDDGDE